MTPLRSETLPSNTGSVPLEALQLNFFFSRVLWACTLKGRQVTKTSKIKEYHNGCNPLAGSGFILLRSPGMMLLRLKNNDGIVLPAILQPRQRCDLTQYLLQWLFPEAGGNGKFAGPGFECGVQQHRYPEMI